MNEKGNTTLLGLTFLLLFSILGSYFIQKQLFYISEQKTKQELLLCTKKVNGLTQNFIQNIKRTNYLLKMLTIGKYASIFIPGINLTTTTGVKLGIKTLKITQQTLLFSFMKNMGKMAMNQCSINPLRVIQTPYQHYGLDFKRNKFNEAKLRSKKWTVNTHKGKFLIMNSFDILQNKTSSTMIEVSLSSML